MSTNLTLTPLCSAAFTPFELCLERMRAIPFVLMEKSMDMVLFKI